MTASPVAIVTGAGTGIGRETCHQLAANGYHVALVGRTQASLERTAELIASEVPNAPVTSVVVADVSVRAQAHAAVDRTLAAWNRIDTLINNAAVLSVQPLAQIDEAALRSTFEVNCFGPAYLIAGCWATFVQQRSGRIVNVSSMSSIDPFPGLGAYGASKSALESLARSAMNEGRTSGILAFNVILGAVETRMLRALVSHDALPTERTLHPSAAAEVIVQCAMGQRDPEAGRTIVVPGP